MNSMGNGALFFFAGVIATWRVVFASFGNIHFWQIAGEKPDKFFAWMLTDNTWVILDPNAQENGYSLPPAHVGPFKLYVPMLGQTVSFIAVQDRMEASQVAFLQSIGAATRPQGSEWPSWLALLYPVSAILSSRSSNGFEGLGIGLANLGYLLGAAGIFPGHFRALGFAKRGPTFIAAVCTWLAGFLLVNMAGR